MTGPDLFGMTLTDAIAALEARGFTESFRAEPDERVKCITCARARHADELPMLAFERVEGMSDPADESIVAGVECPECGARGTLVLAFGSRVMRVGAGVLSHMHTSPPRDH